MNDDKIVLISEIFGPCVQGEGEHIGHPTVFIRTGGCDYRCAWCDTLYAVLPEYNHEWVRMKPFDIVTKVNALTHCKPILVTLSGGNPAMQKNLGTVIDMLHAQDHIVTIETQGTVYPDWADKLDYITVSPKPPSSKMKTNYDQLDQWVHGKDHVWPVLKIVIFEEDDYQYAKAIAKRYPKVKMYLQTGNIIRSDDNFSLTAHRNMQLGCLQWLQNRVLEDEWFDVCVLEQQHVLIYGNKRAV